MTRDEAFGLAEGLKATPPNDKPVRFCAKGKSLVQTQFSRSVSTAEAIRHARLAGRARHDDLRHRLGLERRRRDASSTCMSIAAATSSTPLSTTPRALRRASWGAAQETAQRTLLATKFTMARDRGDPNAGGNHRMNLMRFVEASLRQLDTDRLELDEASAPPPSRAIPKNLEKFGYEPRGRGFDSCQPHQTNCSRTIALESHAPRLFFFAREPAR